MAVSEGNELRDFTVTANGDGTLDIYYTRNSYTATWYDDHGSFTPVSASGTHTVTLYAQWAEDTAE